MSNDFYTKGGVPGTSASGSSAVVRNEFAAIEAGFDKLPALSGNAGKLAAINAGGTAMTTVTAAEGRSALGLVIGTNVQAHDADLTAIAALTSAADKVAYCTGAGSWALADFSAFGRSLVAAADAAAARAIVTPFPAGTVLVFGQTSAPTGWTKSAAHNDKALRVVSGTVGSGGSTAFTSVFGSAKSTASYTLQTADIPAHAHTGTSGGQSADHTHTGPSHTHTGPSHSHTGTTGGASASHHHTFGGGAGVVFVNTGAGVTANVGTTGSGDNAPYTDNESADHTHGFTTDAAGTGATGASGTGATGGVSAGHTHSFTSDTTGGGGGHSHTLSLDLQYVDVILATKD